MKVLLLSLFHPELVRGGAQQVCYELFQGLQEQLSVNPTLLAAIDPTFTTYYKSGARITGFDGRDGEFLYLTRDYDYTWHKTASLDLIAAFEEFLMLVQPDIVHFHHFLLFGVDLISLTRRALPSVKIVFTFHEFVSICAADGHFVRRTDGSLCNRATPARCNQCFPDRGPEQFFLRDKWFKHHFDRVDHFTTPSSFMTDIYKRWGIDSGKISHVSNGQFNHGANAPIERARLKRNRIGFFGQFVDNKGVYLLIQAVQLLRAEGFVDFSVELNGDNFNYASPKRRAEIEDFLKKEAELPVQDQLVTLNGSYQVDQLAQKMARVDWCVVPSVWFETFGLVISEAWMFGRPVIASNVGAMAERITHEKDGLLFNVGDARSLAEAIKRACTEDGLWDKLVGGIVEPPSRDHMVKDYLNLYAKLLNDVPIASGLPAANAAVRAL